jgi:hypothetical protein
VPVAEGKTAEQTVRPGQAVSLKVMEVDPIHHRIMLAVTELGEVPPEPELPPVMPDDDLDGLGDESGEYATAEGITEDPPVAAAEEAVAEPEPVEAAAEAVADVQEPVEAVAEAEEPAKSEAEAVEPSAPETEDEAAAKKPTEASTE